MTTAPDTDSNNKITLDYSYLTLDDDLLGTDVSDGRVRLQWDISF